MKIAITGGTGFIGTYLTRFFIEKGHLVTTIGTRTRKNAIHPQGMIMFWPTPAVPAGGRRRLQRPIW